jgi:hypothetical protein
MASMTRRAQIAEALKVLQPPATERDECRRQVEHALDVMAATLRGVEVIKAERAACRRSGRSYHAALERALAVSKARASDGGALVMPIARLEHAVKFAAEWRAKFSRALPRGAIAERQATALARHLLWQWDRPAPKTRGGPWHELAAILLGDHSADLFRHLRAFRDPYCAEIAPSRV